MTKLTTQDLDNFLRRILTQEELRKFKANLIEKEEDENAYEKHLDFYLFSERVQSIKSAPRLIAGAFTWSDSPEGHTYWQGIWERALAKVANEREEKAPVEEPSTEVGLEESSEEKEPSYPKIGEYVRVLTDQFDSIHKIKAVSGNIMYWTGGFCKVSDTTLSQGGGRYKFVLNYL